MYLLVIKRYLLTLIRSTTLACCLWAFLIWLQDGLLPIMGFFVVIATLVFSVPVKLYYDYRDIRSQVLKLNDVRKGQGDLTPYLSVLIEKVAVKTGIPTLVVEFIITLTQKPIQRWLSKRHESPEPTSI
jgi:predicted membrane metal-binding protein